eukprot:TRINITY_DN631_c4_g1_i1.p1 TRINITY_DN631_c4_g1~~TRINITY_DN631_c4_g1_i1.p1  ORF type:complete len:977 (-),score=224.45 TRINITY_DN631_c4_g1_i1:39-2969(-)
MEQLVDFLRKFELEGDIIEDLKKEGFEKIEDLKALKESMLQKFDLVYQIRLKDLIIFLKYEEIIKKDIPLQMKKHLISSIENLDFSYVDDDFMSKYNNSLSEEDKKEIRDTIWKQEKNSVLNFFRKMFQTSPYLSEMIKKDMNKPLPFHERISTNTSDKFSGKKGIFSQMEDTFSKRTAPIKENEDIDTKEERKKIFALPSASGNGKTSFLHHIYLESIKKKSNKFGFKDPKLSQKLRSPICCLQVYYNGDYRLNKVIKGNQESYLLDASTRIILLYFLSIPRYQWKITYEFFYSLMPRYTAQVIELCFFDFKERKHLGNEKPVIILLFDEMSKLFFNVEGETNENNQNLCEYVSAMSKMIETFDKIGDNPDGLKNLTEASLINIYTALNPLTITDVSLLKTGSDRMIKWVLLKKIKFSFISSLLPKNLKDVNSKHLATVGAVWTNGSPKILREYIKELEKMEKQNELLISDIYKCFSGLTIQPFPLSRNDCWMFIATIFCNFSLLPKAHLLGKSLFDLVGSYFLNSTFSLEELYRGGPISGFETSKLILYLFGSLTFTLHEDRTLQGLIKKLLELEINWSDQSFEPYIYRIILIRLNCWLFLYKCRDVSIFTEELLRGEISNSFLFHMKETGLLPLEAIFMGINVWKDEESKNEFRDIMINMKSCKNNTWSQKEFFPETTELLPFFLYVPNSQNYPGLDVKLVFLNHLEELSSLDIQIKGRRATTSEESTISNLTLASSIANTYHQFSNIKKKNGLQLENSFYLMLSKKPLSHKPGKWKNQKLKKNKELKEQDITEIYKEAVKNCSKFGGIYSLSGNQFKVFLGPSLSTLFYEKIDFYGSLLALESSPQEQEIICERTNSLLSPNDMVSLKEREEYRSYELLQFEINYSEDKEYSKQEMINYLKIHQKRPKDEWEFKKLKTNFENLMTKNIGSKNDTSKKRKPVPNKIQKTKSKKTKKKTWKEVRVGKKDKNIYK